MRQTIPIRRLLAMVIVGVLLVIVVGVLAFWGDLMRSALDPKAPFQTYTPPAAPNYANPRAWLLQPETPLTIQADEPSADVFFISPTTFSGGRDWNGPIDDARSDRVFRRVMAPNYVGPFVRLGRVFAPRYRQASLYSLLTLREDARAARAFAYGDVAQAFRYYLAHYNQGRPLLIVGVEQGGTLGARLLAEEVAPNSQLRARLAVAYLEETAVSAPTAPLPACERRGQTGCLAAWVSAPDTELDEAQTLLDRALVFGPTGELENLNGKSALCFNPILGATTDLPAAARTHLGGANATGLEWGARPGFLARQVGARCEDGVLRYSRPKSSSLREAGDWSDRHRVPGYNLFYADLENDARSRLAALTRP